jgi:hypothetical protein
MNQPELTMIRTAAARRFADAMAEVRSAALDLSRIEATMTDKSLDQSGGHEAAAFGTSNGDGGRGIAAHRADRAAQDAKVGDLARRVVDNATGGVPKPMGKG